MRALDPSSIDTLVSVKGMVTRCSTIIPDLKQAYFRCCRCSHVVEVMIERGRIEEPSSCPACQINNAMEIVHNRCLFSDKQMIRMQETADEVPEGEMPYSTSIFAFDDLVDSVRPGDRVEITGIYRAVPKRANPRIRTIKSVYKTYIDCIHFRRLDSGDSSMTSLQGRDNFIGSSSTTALPTFSEEKIRKFHRFAQFDDAYDRLTSGK
jgi:DNA replication licensing factor MCM4